MVARPYYFEGKQNHLVIPGKMLYFSKEKRKMDIERYLEVYISYIYIYIYDIYIGLHIYIPG